MKTTDEARRDLEPPTEPELRTVRDRTVRIWLSRYCQDCHGRKPLFTAYCDACAERHGL